MSSNGKGSKRRPSRRPGAYEDGWERVFGRKRAVRAKRARKGLDKADPTVAQ
jgi:hypothetical protein